MGVKEMYCSLCQRIIDIRKNQGKDYYDDLCGECKKEYLRKNKNRDKKLVYR